MACGRQLPRFRLIDAFDEHFDVIINGAGDRDIIRSAEV